jgi:hypothetical protein
MKTLNNINNTNNTQNNNYLAILYAVGAWFVYWAIYELLRSVTNHDTWAGWFGFVVSDIIFSLIPCAFAFGLWRKSSGKTKSFFGLLSLAFISNFVVACIYTIFFSILHLPHKNVHGLILASYNIPYIVVLLSLFLAFGNVFPKAKIYAKKHSNFFLYAPTVIIITIISTLFFTSYSAHTNSDSSFLSKFYDIADIALQIAGVITALLCLIVSKNKGLFMLSLAYTVFIVSELIMNVAIFGESYWAGDFLETFYFLSCILSMYGLSYLKKSNAFQQDLVEWIKIHSNNK